MSDDSEKDSIAYREKAAHLYLNNLIASAENVRRRLAPGDERITFDFLDILRNAHNKVTYLEICTKE